MWKATPYTVSMQYWPLLSSVGVSVTDWHLELWVMVAVVGILCLEVEAVVGSQTSQTHLSCSISMETNADYQHASISSTIFLQSPHVQNHPQYHFGTFTDQLKGTDSKTGSTPNDGSE